MMKSDRVGILAVGAGLVTDGSEELVRGDDPGDGEREEESGGEDGRVLWEVAPIQAEGEVELEQENGGGGPQGPGKEGEGGELGKAAKEVAEKAGGAKAEGAVGGGVAGELPEGRGKGVPGAVEGFCAGGEVRGGELARDAVEEAVFAEEDGFGEAAGLLPEGFAKGHGAGGAGL